MLQKRWTGPIKRLQPREPIINHIFVDTESTWSQIDGKTPIAKHVLRFGCAKYCQWNGMELVEINRIVFHNRKLFWRWIKKNLSKDSTWVWAHNLTFDGTLLGLWDCLQANECKLSHFTDCDLPSFYQCQLWGMPVQFLDSLNIFKASLSSLGIEIGLEKMEMPSQHAPLDEWMPYCWRDVDVLHKIVERWMQFLKEHGLGRMAPTLASQALTAYRTNFMHRDIHLHCQKNVTLLERDAYNGGIVEPKFVGKVDAKVIYEYDVNSLYPYVMKERMYPNLLMGYDVWPKKDRIKELLSEYYCIAQCKIETTNEVFPVRRNGRLMFPLGNYWTTLHQPEIERAAIYGCLKEVAFIAYYTQADLFSDYVNFFYDLRKTYTHENDRSYNFMCKLFLNSLYGKFGQRRPLWETYTLEKLRDLEYDDVLSTGELDTIKDHIECYEQHELKWTHPGNNKEYRARRILGIPQFMIGEAESSYSFPAISGAVTAYAREYVRSIQRILVRKHLFYTDTDSFFTDKRGSDLLRDFDMLSDTELGKLKSKTTSDWMIIHGPKDYETDCEVKRKGIRAKALDLGSGRFSQEQWPGFKSIMRQGFPSCIDVKTITKKLKRELLTMRLGTDGWTHPLLIDDNHIKSYRSK